MRMMLKTGLVAGLASAALAQNVERIQVRQAANNELRQTFEFISGQLVSGPPVKGAPYSAEAVNETIQTLADGNRIVQRTTQMQYRDTDGRERREETSAMGVIFITDPVAGARYTLHPESQTAEKGPMAGFNLTTTGDGNVFYYANSGVSGAVARRAGRGQVTEALAGRAPEGRGGAPATFAIATAGRMVATSGDVKEDQLGNMYIEGVQAEGTRVTTTIPAGEIGNDRPINILDERWYSPDLQMTVMTKHSDPRSGETNFQLKNINRSNPPPTLFEVPSDYTMNAGGARGGRSGGPAPGIQLNGIPLKK